jgi:two-component system OmpR family response regulator
MPGASQQRSHKFQADLRRTALPEMLHTIFLHRVSGVLEASRGQVEKKVYIRGGEVLYATSSDLDDSLGVYLRRTEQVSEEQFKASMAERAESEKRLGELLVEQGILSPADLHQAIQDQIEAIVWSLFSWQDGEVVFKIGEVGDSEIIHIHLPMQRVILQGIKRSPNAKSLVTRLGHKDTLFEPTFTTEKVIEVALDAQELALLKLVDGKRTLYELCVGGPFKAPENARLLYAYFVLRLIKRGHPLDSGAVKIRLPGR